MVEPPESAGVFALTTGGKSINPAGAAQPEEVLAPYASRELNSHVFGAQVAVAGTFGLPTEKKIPATIEPFTL